jgi:hypothetical protein
MQQNARKYSQLDAAIVEIETEEQEYYLARALLLRSEARGGCELAQEAISQARRLVVTRIDAVVAQRLN